MGRPAFKVTAGRPGSDVAGDTAAALAAGSLVFKNICGSKFTFKFTPLLYSGYFIKKKTLNN